MARIVTESLINWKLYKNFSESEYECKCSCRSLARGEATINETLLQKIQELRDRCGFALPINSGLRCKKHNDDPKVGGHPNSAHIDHGEGCMAVDLGVDRERGRIALKEALNMDCFFGVGLQQKGTSGRFLHLDIKPRNGTKAFWTYA